MAFPPSPTIAHPYIQVAEFCSDLSMFVNRKERLLALLSRYRIMRHRSARCSRRGALVRTHNVLLVSFFLLFWFANAARLRPIYIYAYMNTPSDLEDVCRDDPDGTNTAARQHASSFFEVEELLPEELEYAGNSPWSSWRTTLAKQLRGEGMRVGTQCAYMV